MGCCLRQVFQTVLPCFRRVTRSGSAIALTLSSLQISEQSLQCLLIINLVLPLTKIANEAYSAGIPCPSRVRLHHSIIEADGKEDECFRWLTFPLESQFHFSLHPIAFDSVF